MCCGWYIMYDQAIWVKMCRYRDKINLLASITILSTQFNRLLICTGLYRYIHAALFLAQNCSVCTNLLITKSAYYTIRCVCYAAGHNEFV
jgi:hypothetical protein